MLALPANAQGYAENPLKRDDVVEVLGAAKAIARVCGRSVYNESLAAMIMVATGLDPTDERDRHEVETAHNVYLNTRPLTDTREYYCNRGRELFGQNGTVAPNLIQF